MSESVQEEILASLAVIAAILAFGFDFYFCGYVFVAKAINDTVCAIIKGIQETKKEAQNDV